MTMPNATRSEPEPTTQELDLLRHLRGLRFGQVVVQVHDAHIVQIERTERFRPDPRAEAIRGR
jgi:hypothetical protein